MIVAVGEKLESEAGRSSWVKAIEQQVCVVEIWPIERASAALDPATGRRHAEAHERGGPVARGARRGQLLAADQEIKRLALTAAGREVDEAEVLEFVANNSRFDVFALADAVLAGETGRTFKILSGLRAEGVHPVQISWVLNRDISMLRGSSTPCATATISKARCMRSGVWQAAPTARQTGARRSSGRRG